MVSCNSSRTEPLPLDAGWWSLRFSAWDKDKDKDRGDEMLLENEAAEQLDGHVREVRCGC